MHSGTALQTKGAFWRPFVCLLLLCAWLCLWPLVGQAGCPAPQTAPLTVSYVIDGDTLVLEDGRHVRLIGVNTPEKNSGKLAARAKQHMQRWLSENHKQVRLAYGPERFDRYERTLAYVFANQKDLGAALLESGLAWFVVVPPNQAHADCYLALEVQARRAQRGLWQQDKAVTSAAQVTRHSGFILAHGTITRVSEPAGHVVLTLDNTLDVFIHRRDRDELTALPDNLDTLTKQHIEARGWLYDYKGTPNLRIMHPAMLGLAPPEE